MADIRIRIIALLLAALAASCAKANHSEKNHAGSATQSPATQTSTPPVAILIADIDRSYGANGEPKNTFTTLRPSHLGFKKATIEQEAESDFTAFLTVDPFPNAIGFTLVVKVNDRVFVPVSCAGDHDLSWSLELKHIDRATAEALYGGSLRLAPADHLKVSYQLSTESYPLDKPVSVGLWIANVSSETLTFYWGTTGGGNYPCRDKQLSFTAKLNGNPVPAASHPLPNGFISSPFTAKPNQQLKRSVDLSEWLQFDKPGKYIVDATYSVTINNPINGASPQTWTAVYRDQFSVQIGQ